MKDLKRERLRRIIAEGFSRGLYTEADISVRPRQGECIHASFSQNGELDVYRARLFDIASITKAFLALLVYRLTAIDNNKEFTLDALVVRFVDLSGPFVDELTVRHLLTFHATFSWFMTPAEMLGKIHTTDTPAKTRVFKEMLDQMDSVGLVGPPGLVHRYGNVHSILLGRVLENAFGMKLEQLIDMYLCKPLGLGDTLIDPLSRADRCVPAGYGLRIGQVSDPVAQLARSVYSRTFGSAGLFSTTQDLLTLLDVIHLGERHSMCPILDSHVESLHVPLTVQSKFGQGFGLWSEFRRNLEKWNPTEPPDGIFKSGFSGCIMACSRKLNASFAFATNFLHKSRTPEEMRIQRRYLNTIYASLAECAFTSATD